MRVRIAFDSKHPENQGKEIEVDDAVGRIMIRDGRAVRVQTTPGTGGTPQPGAAPMIVARGGRKGAENVG